MNAWMRTTIELDDEVRTELIRRSAERGDRGYSELINEILRLHLAEDAEHERKRRERLADELEGSWGEEVAEEARRRIKESRANWRVPQRH